MCWWSNRRAGAKYLSVYWYLVLVLVTGAIVAAVFMFYNNSYDVREEEAGILIEKVADCFSDAGILKDSPENLKLEDCGFNFEDKNYEGEQYYLETNFYELKNCDINKNLCTNPIAVDKKGQQNYKSFCINSGKKFPLCKSRKFYVYSLQDKKKIIVEVLAVVNKVKG